jgi:hypothetical protein
MTDYDKRFVKAKEELEDMIGEGYVPGGSTVCIDGIWFIVPKMEEEFEHATIDLDYIR